MWSSQGGKWKTEADMQGLNVNYLGSGLYIRIFPVLLEVQTSFSCVHNGCHSEWWHFSAQWTKNNSRSSWLLVRHMSCITWLFLSDLECMYISSFFPTARIWRWRNFLSVSCVSSLTQVYTLFMSLRACLSRKYVRFAPLRRSSECPTEWNLLLP